MSQLELGKQYGRQKPEKRVNAVFWIILLNLAIFVADHIFLVLDLSPSFGYISLIYIFFAKYACMFVNIDLNHAYLHREI